MARTLKVPGKRGNKLAMVAASPAMNDRQTHTPSRSTRGSLVTLVARDRVLTQIHLNLAPSHILLKSVILLFYFHHHHSWSNSTGDRCQVSQDNSLLNNGGHLVCLPSTLKASHGSQSQWWSQCSAYISKCPVDGYCPQLKTPWGNSERKDGEGRDVTATWEFCALGVLSWLRGALAHPLSCKNTLTLNVSNNLTAHWFVSKLLKTQSVLLTFPWGQHCISLFVNFLYLLKIFFSTWNVLSALPSSTPSRFGAQALSPGILSLCAHHVVFFLYFCHLSFQTVRYSWTVTVLPTLAPLQHGVRSDVCFWSLGAFADLLDRKTHSVVWVCPAYLHSLLKLLTHIRSWEKLLVLTQAARQRPLL